jgi:hypothetical protein
MAAVLIKNNYEYNNSYCATNTFESNEDLAKDSWRD